MTELAMHSIGTKFKKGKGRYIISGICLFKFKKERGKLIDPREIEILIGNNPSCGKISFAGKGISLAKGIRLGKYEIFIEEEALPNLDIQNKIQIKYGETLARIKYSFFDRATGKHKVSRVFKYDEVVCFIKQSALNGLYLTVREPQIYDEMAERRKVFVAWLLAKFWLKRDIIFMFEKECAKYEESASILYEKIIDKGYSNVYFIVNEDNPVIRRLDEKYKTNLIYKDSFRHLLYFFKSHTFIGTEMMSHAVQLRTSNRRILKKTESKNISYVFLQHGPTYMVPLNAERRIAFRAKGLKMHRIVVSSQLEANHFVECGGFKANELYITGIAKFDKSIRHENPDRIVIMPTWRRWDANQARKDFTKTSYYSLIEKIIEAVPDELKEKITVLMHPLMLSAMSDDNNKLKKYMATESHDETLKSCDLLITDYSSVAYDAYYRGSNVIFYWEEKEECMSNYGPNTKLLLTEELAFGEVCYDVLSLKDSIRRVYGQKQKQEDMDKYEQIIEFKDGKNSDRIVDCLMKEGIL